jgi:hypothetical protein
MIYDLESAHEILFSFISFATVVMSYWLNACEAETGCWVIAERKEIVDGEHRRLYHLLWT